MRKGIAVALLQLYPRILAVALALAGAAAISGIVQVAHGVGVLYLFTATIFAYGGFWNREAEVIRSLVGGLGVLYLLYGLGLAAVYLAWGFPYEGRGFLQSLANAAFGGLNVLFASVWSGEGDNPKDKRGP